MVCIFDVSKRREMDCVTTYPKARKIHKCDFCNGEIQVGEVYNRQAVFDGNAWTHKAHETCIKLADVMNMFDDPDGLTAEYFRENVRQYWIEKNQYNELPSFLEVLEEVKKDHKL